MAEHTLQVHNGSSWGPVAVPKVWDGTKWVAKAKYYNGSVWHQLYVTPASETITVTRGTYNAGKGGNIWYGFSQSPLPTATGGNVSPTVVSGHTITGIHDLTSSDQFLIRLETAGLGAGFFTTARVENGVGTYVNLATASATYTAGAGYSQWTWSSPSGVTWANGGNRTVEFIF